MCIDCCPPSPNVLGGEIGASGGNHPETAGFISFFPYRLPSKSGDKVLLAEKHTGVVVVVVVVASVRN